MRKMTLFFTLTVVSLLGNPLIVLTQPFVNPTSDLFDRQGCAVSKSYLEFVPKAFNYVFVVKKFGAIGVEIVCDKAQNQGYFTFSNVQASVLAESKIEYGFYRLTEPSRPFYDRMRKEGRVGFFGTIFGPPPPEMAPYFRHY
ncbi:MAG: hypothetical protein QXO75_09440 [Nitrososphaerota archaeon]